MENKSIVLVTGANRGIGFEVCRQLGKKGYRVILAARDANNAKTSAETLAGEGLDVTALTLDVTDQVSVDRARADIEKKFGALDALVNNAGVFTDVTETASTLAIKKLEDIFQINVFGAWRMAHVFVPLLKKSEHARLVNVSSQMGSFGGQPFGITVGTTMTGYAASKAALNALTIKLALELKESRVLVNSVCPGWTATYKGAKEQGARPVEEGAASVVWAVTLPDNGPTGGFYRDGQPLAW